MGVKISELVEKTTANSSDVIPIVDTGTKKMKLSTLLSLVFPIGSTYITQDSTDPKSILGFGTWERLKGRVCVGLDENDTAFNKIGQTGGEKTHTLTVAEMPKHKHTSPIDSYVNADSQTNVVKGGHISKQPQSSNFDTSYSGGGTAHNNLQPYQVVGYMWIRRK